MFPEGLFGILGTAWPVNARRREEDRDQPLVNPNDQQKRTTDETIDLLFYSHQVGCQEIVINSGECPSRPVSAAAAWSQR